MDTLGPQKLWGWIRGLVPKPGLETFKLHAFTINMGHTSIPRMFILDLAVVHSDTLKHFMVGEAQLTLKDVECLCSKFTKLETLVCSVASPDVVCGDLYPVCHVGFTAGMFLGIDRDRNCKCEKLADSETASAVDTPQQASGKRQFHTGTRTRDDAAGRGLAIAGYSCRARLVYG